MDHHPKPLRRRSDKRGFTLVELLAVIGVMVMLLAFTMPVLRSGSNMNKTAWDIAGVIEQAQTYAQSQNTYVWVGLNTEAVSNAQTRRVSVFTIASVDGTATTATSNLVHLDRVQTFENVALETANQAKFEYGNRSNNDVVYLVTPGPTLTMPTSVIYRPKGGSVVNLFNNNRNIFLQIHPDGSITPGTGTAQNWLELGLQGMKGTAPTDGDTAVLRTSSLTGRTAVFRAGSAATEAAEED